MDKIKTVQLLNALLEKTEDASLKHDIEAIIKEINSKPDESGVIKKEKPISENDKKTASGVIDVIGRFFGRLTTSVIVKEIIDRIHDS